MIKYLTSALFAEKKLNIWYIGERLINPQFFGHVSKYSCYDLKQSSKVNLSVYFLPADGWEKVIKIRRFSNGTAIKDIIN
ncbi:MAG: hypothetical protein LBR79_05640 [Oscillospiraceae bacterium]|nr:hypothetical protein [Oscillospiraceae bacterium]